MDSDLSVRPFSIDDAAPLTELLNEADAVAAGYAARAAEYADLLGSMSAVHPSDRELIESWARRRSGRVVDAGCGPGHWTNHLAGLGVDVHGIDLVPSFIEHARSAYPGIHFDVQSIDRIDEPAGSMGGVFAWFSTIHHEPSAVATPIGEFARILRPGGQLALGFFIGPAIEAFDHAVVRAYRWPPERLYELVKAAGFDIVETHRREAPGERPVGAIIAERRGTPTPGRP